MLDEVTTARPQVVDQLIKNFWPGPLTLLLPKSAAIPKIVTAGRQLVGVRMPADPVALALISAAGVPLAAPSANRFGHTSPTRAQHVIDDLNGRIDCILDAGPCQHGVESTVLDPNQKPMLIYRPGAITREQIEAATGVAVALYREPEQLSELPHEALPSPGVGLRHYAPGARLVLFEAQLDEMPEAIAKIIHAEHREHHDANIGVLAPTELIQRLTVMLYDGAGNERGAKNITLLDWGRWHQPAELGVNLFASLRELDAHGCGIIIAPVPSTDGIGAAIRDRMRKAASTAPIDKKI
jgi:L-threonylcarbamoyladenylate synthase